MQNTCIPSSKAALLHQYTRAHERPINTPKQNHLSIARRMWYDMRAMRLKNIPGSREAIAASEYVIPETGMGEVWPERGHWHEIFGNESPIRIEAGMGKGTFIMELARQNPDINYIGIEKYSSVLLRAVQKQEQAQLPNIRFIRMDAEYICDVFAPGEVDRIYLNFSDPWPKDRHAKRRLTSRQFLARYEQILKDGGQVEFKTDNVDLFAFSLEEVPEAGWHLLAETRDLHASCMNTGNIMTEYEQKFSALGQKICKYIIQKP